MSVSCHSTTDIANLSLDKKDGYSTEVREVPTEGISS